MLNYIKPVLRDIGEAVAREAREASKRSLPDIIAIAVTIILILTGVAAVVITAYMYLAEVFLDRHAMLIVTLNVIVLAAFSGFLTWQILTRNMPPPRKAKQSDDRETTPESQTEMAALLGAEAGKLVTDNPKNASIIALVAGVFMGISPELRAALFSQILPKK